MPVKELTKSNCTEDERFILEYLQQKREKRAEFAKETSDDEDDADSVNDDEFDALVLERWLVSDWYESFFQFTGTWMDSVGKPMIWTS